MTKDVTLLVWMILASVIIGVDRWRIAKLEDENKKLWALVNDKMRSPAPFTRTRKD